MQTCITCQIEKPDWDFSWEYKDKGIRQTACKKCHSAYNKQHYKNNKSKYDERSRIRNIKGRHDNIEKLYEYLKTHPCIDCGESNPLKLEFDHVRGDKENNVSALIGRRGSWEHVMEEVTKCEVRCANCHRVRHAFTQGWYLVELMREDGLVLN